MALEGDLPATSDLSTSSPEPDKSGRSAEGDLSETRTRVESALGDARLVSHSCRRVSLGVVGWCKITLPHPHRGVKENFRLDIGLGMWYTHVHADHDDDLYWG